MEEDAYKFLEKCLEKISTIKLKNFQQIFLWIKLNCILNDKLTNQFLKSNFRENSNDRRFENSGIIRL